MELLIKSYIACLSTICYDGSGKTGGRIFMVCNLLSLFLGLLALGFAIHSVYKKLCPVCSFLSFGCCGGALLSQLLEIRRRVEISDWSALMDTMDAVIFAAAGLLVLTALLNGLALVRNRKM